MSFDLATNVAALGSLADFTRPALILPELRQRDTAGVIHELSQALQREGCIPDLLPFYHSALNQELLANSALDCGMAMPHARLSGVKQLHFALGRCSQPVIWGSKASWSVQLVFLLAVPATDAATYLHLLASLARLGRQPKLLAELRGAGDSTAMLATLEKVRLRQS